MSLDPVLYLAFGGGYAAGRWTGFRSPWIGRAATGAVGALLFLLGVELGSGPLPALLAAVPWAIAFAVATLLVTLGLFAVLRRERPTVATPTPAAPLDVRIPLAFVLLVVVGLAAGRATGTSPGPLTEYVLDVLLALVGFELTVVPGRLREAWAPITAAVLGGLAVGATFVVLAGVPARVSFATASAFGWYSLAGPLVAAQAGPGFGAFAFLANFLRENLTMLSAPWLGRRFGGSGIAAMGGATSMDTTLYFVTRYGSADSATVGLATGLVLTVTAALAVPALLAVV